MKFRAIAVTSLFLVLAGVANAQKVIRLYPGGAPGSENLTQQRKEYFSQVWNTKVVTNVSQPSLTAYVPAPGLANGTAVVVCPGGGFHALSIDSEGIDVAKWLNAKGVAAFVLEYRLVPTGEDGTKEFMAKLSNLKKLDEDNAAVIPLAISDGFRAIAYVRSHAAEFGVSPSRIGLIGFSAGGAIAAAVALGYTAENRPDFVAPIYGYLAPVKVNEAAVPKDAPPMFIAVASDDQFRLVPDSLTLYGRWLAASRSAEMHIYSKGGHGFGMRKQNLPSDHWIDRFGEWLEVQGLLKLSH
jgi:acetyl esterase/lipase